MRVIKLLTVSSLALGVLTITSPADLIGSVTAVPGANTVYNLTDLGTLDWAFYDTNSNGASDGLPTNSRLGGTALGTIIALGGGGVRGTSVGTTEPDFTYTDGTSPASGTGENPGGLFNSQLDTLGAGIQLAIDLPTTDLYTITLWTAAFFARGTLTASLPGFSSYSDQTTDDNTGAGPKQSYMYTFTAQANSAGDDLTINLVTDTDRGASAHVLIAGAAISVVPEPATLAMLLSGLGALGVMRRRSTFSR